MTIQVEVETRIPGGLLGAPDRLVLEFPWEETLSIGELIRLKVEEEARRLAAMETLDQLPRRASLGREYQELTATPPPPPTPMNLATEVHKAQQAFANGRFLILVNGQRYTRLDEQVTLTPQTNIKFIRLMPLTGG